MKRPISFFLLLLVLAALCGWLLSHLNFIGRLGVNTMHTEYRFLTAWWKGAGLVLGVWLLLWSLHSTVGRKLPLKTSRAFHAAGLLLAILGLYATYRDFRTNFSHRIIGERFHLGAYLFWAGWLLVAIRCWMIVDKQKTSTNLQQRNEKVTFVDK